MEFRSVMGSKRFVTLALILVLALSLASPVQAADNEVEVRMVGRGIIDLDGSAISAGTYSITVEHSVQIGNWRDKSGKSLRKVEMTVKPKRPDSIREINTNNAELISEDPIVLVGKGLGEDEGMEVNIQTRAKIDGMLPLTVKRAADVTYFEGPGKQVVSVTVTPQSPDLRDLHIGFEFRPWSGREETDVRFISASRENFDRSEKERADFHVQSPVEGKEYVFAVQLEVTPLSGQATYLPNVWVGASVEGKQLESVKGRTYSHETEALSVEIKSEDEVVFVPWIGREIGVGMQGISTQAKLLDIETPPPEKAGEALSTEERESEPAVVLPMGQPIMSISREGGLYGIDWEFVGVILVVLGTAVGTVVTWAKGRKRRGVVSRYIRQIDAVYTEQDTGPADKREELRKMKREISKQLGKGKLDEGAYGILDKRLDDYLKELRSSAGVSNIELKAEIDKILEDGVVTKEEYDEFSEMLEKGSELKAGEKKDLKEKIKKIRDESEKKGY